MTRTKVSFMIDKEVLKMVKQRALDEETTQTELFNKWIIKGLNEKTEK